MLFQMVNNVVMTLALPANVNDTTLVVMNRDLPDAQKYDPTKQLSLTLVGDEELNQYEIVYVTARSGTTFTVVRGQEDTTRQGWPAGTKIIAALSAGMLEKLTETPTSADQVAYGGGNFGASGTVEETLDDMGDAIIRIMASTDYHEDVSERISGGNLSNISVLTSGTGQLRWQAFGGRILTDGFATKRINEATIASPSFAPEVVLCVRTEDTTKFGSLEIRIYNHLDSTDNCWVWNTAAISFQINDAWIHVYFGAVSAAKVGDPTSVDLDRIRLTWQDKGTGALTVDVNFVDIVEPSNSYLGSFVRVQTVADFNKVWQIERFGFQVSIVVEIEDLQGGLVDLPTLRKAESDGNRIYLTSNQSFLGMTKDQIMVKLFTGVRLAAEADLRPAGFVYPQAYNGPPSDGDNFTIRECVQQAYPRGVGTRSFRSAVDVYRFDDPLVVVADLAGAQAQLTGSDMRSINIDVSALTQGEIYTLYQEVFTSKNFYQTNVAWQNADNIKSGTLGTDRLPIVPVVKGGTGATTVVAARNNLGVEWDVDVPHIGGPWLAPVGVPMPWCSTVVPVGWVFLQGAVLARASYPKLFAAYGTRFNTGGETTAQFRLPDLRGRIIAGIDNATERLPGLDVIGQVMGAATVVLTAAQLPNHTHSAGTLTAVSAGAHTHNVAGRNTIDASGISAVFIHPTLASGAPNALNAALSAGAHTHDVTGNTGNNVGTVGQAHSIVQPTMGWNWITRLA